MRVSKVVLSDDERDAAIRIEHQGKPASWIDDEVREAAAPRLKAQADYDKSIGKVS